MSDTLTGLDKDLRKAARVATDASWTIRKTRNGHYRWLAPTGETVVTAGTASDHRSHRNALALLRKAGLAV